MAENYVVNYQINVNSDPALESIRKFQEATAQMEALSKRFDTITKGIGRVNSALASLNKGRVEIRLDTSRAEAGLRRVLNLLSQVKAQAQTTMSNNRVQVGRGATTIGGTSTLNTRSAAVDLTNLAKKIKSTQASIDNINKRYIHPKANTKTAINSLDALIRKIQQVKSQSNITITATASGASRTVNPTAVPAGTSSRTSRTSGGAGHSTYLYPSTRQVLGPTYANTGANVAGEMIKGMGIAYGLSSLMSGITDVFRESTAYDNITQTTKNILETHDKLPGFEGRFDEMNRTMRQVGVETKFTAPQVASAGKFLAMAGLNVDQIKNAIRPISDIALVGDTDLGETADVVTNIMTAYEIPANRMNNAADVLTMTFTKTNTTLLELAESFKYAGTIAHQTGLDFETSSAAFGVLGDAGIKGSHAGTTLRMMLLNMMNPTKRGQQAWETLGISTKDEYGNLRNFADILSDLHKKQQSMSSGDFTSLINQMFRITAAPGALALISNVGKMKEVIDLNTNSFNIASQLADEKKNTILGLWDQMTSAFTETGMQQFEAMQNVIRDFLKRMIALMESPEFAKALGNMMEMFMKLINVIIDVFKKIMAFWNWLPGWVKNGLVLFVKIQMTLGIIAGIGQSILSTWLMIRGVVAGSWLSSFFLKPLATALGYLIRIYNVQRNYHKLSIASSLINTVGGGIWGGAKRGWAALTDNVIGSAGNTGASRMINAGGGRARNILARAAYATPWGALVGLGSWLFTNPLGWITGAVVGVGILGHQVYKTYQATEAARKANEAWGESYRNLGIDKLNLADSDALIIGNMRIFNNELLTQDEKLAKSTEMWHEYWKAVNGPKKEEQSQAKFAETDEGQLWANQLKIANKWFGVDKAFKPLMESMGGRIVRQDYLNAQGKAYSTYGINLFGTTIPLDPQTRKIDRNVAIQLALAQLGADPNNKQATELEEYLSANIITAHSYKDYLNIIDAARKRYVPTSYDSRWDKIRVSTAEDMTWGDIERSRLYSYALRDNQERILKSWADFGKIIQDFDSNKSIDPIRIQAILQKRFGPLFDTTKGLFGTNEWLNYVQDIVNNPTKYKFDSVKDVTEHITDIFNRVLSWYNMIDLRYKPLFAQFLERTPYMSALPQGYNFPEGGVRSGSKLGDTMTVNGITYTWSQLAPELTPHWRDKEGRIYTPMDAKNTFKWTPTTTNNDLSTNLHNGSDQSRYRSHYDNTTAAPKQVIVRIENLMRVDHQTIDMTDDKQVAAINNIKQELATALLDVVQDFNANMA